MDAVAGAAEGVVAQNAADGTVAAVAFAEALGFVEGVGYAGVFPGAGGRGGWLVADSVGGSGGRGEIIGW